MSAYKVFPSGAWRVSDIIGGYLVQRVYFGYTKREAVQAFRAEFKRDAAIAKAEGRDK